MSDELRAGIEALAEEWENDVLVLIRRSTNYEDGAAAQAAHCAHHLRVLLHTHPDPERS